MRLSRIPISSFKKFQSLKDPKTWNMKIFQKFDKIKLYQQIAQAGVVKIMITIPLTLETMRQPIIKPWKRIRTLVSEKMIKNSRRLKKT